MNAVKDAWLDRNLYPFQSRYINLRAGRMHYIDEGKGPVILFVHGTPTWSFLYREFVKELSKNFRCIAMDHLGFGLSDKSEDFGGSPEDHAANLVEFVERLGLSSFTLVVHDFGGPIGLGAGVQLKDRVNRVVLFNSWLWDTKSNPEAVKIDKIVRSGLGKFLYLRLNFSAKVLLRGGFSDKKKLTQSIHRHYLSPFPNKISRLGPWKMGKALVGSSDWYQRKWEELDALSELDWLVLWGEKDAFIDQRFLAKWRRRLPNGIFQSLDCGHFVPEEKTTESIREIRNFCSEY